MTLLDSRPEAGSPLLITVPYLPHGPVISRLLRRTWIGLGLLWIVGMALLLTGSGPLEAIGLGLFVPGAGFLHTSSLLGVLWLVLTLALFAVALIAWFGSGMIVAPPIVVAVACGLSALGADDSRRTPLLVAVPSVVLAVVVAGVLGSRRAFRAAQARGRARNRYLSEVRLRDAAPIGADSFPELGEAALDHQRHLLDLALQSVEEFAGFDFVDQFQTSAVRYQLNFAQFALSLGQLCHTPSFHGYVSEAQRNLIAKMQLKPVWSYWRWENLWGNFDTNPDPIPRDNIMLSGYLGTMLGSYEKVTGDHRYAREGALTFSWDAKRSFSYSSREIAFHVHKNFKRYEIGLFPCEPNWIYTACNAFGMNALHLNDQLAGTDYFDDVVDAYRVGVETEFATADGRVTAIRSSRLGLTIPALTSTMADAGSAMFAHGITPDISQRLWAVVIRELLSLEDGQVQITQRGWDKIDVGTYKRSDATAVAMLSAVACEMGETDLLRALHQKAGDELAPEGGRLTRASTNANAIFAMSHLGRKDGWRDLMVADVPDAIRTGPFLDDAPFGHVRVARAVSDGRALDLVLRPQGAPGRVALGVARLRPGQAYAVHGGVTHDVVADHEGRARVEVDLDGRTVVRVRPVGAL
jgi:hypothetical protein